MKWLRIGLVISVWSISGVASGAALNAFDRYRYPERDARQCMAARNQDVALGMLVGPLGLVVILFATGMPDGLTLDAAPARGTP